MIVFHGRTSLQAGGARAGRAVHWEDADVAAVQAEAPDCEYAIPELEQDDVRAHSNYNNAAFTVTGSHPPFGYIRSLDVGEGRFYNWDDQREARRVAFLGSDAAKQLFPGPQSRGRERLSECVSLHRHRRDGEKEAGFQLRRLGREQDIHSFRRHAARFSRQAAGHLHHV